MIHFLLGSHGTMANGIKSSLNILLGNADNLTVINAYIDEKNVNEELDKYFAKIDENETVVMMSDLLGGSVNQMMYRWWERPHTKLIAGVNLALVLELIAGCSSANDVSDEYLEEKITEARNAMSLVKLDTNVEEDTDDFF